MKLARFFLYSTLIAGLAACSKPSPSESPFSRGVEGELPGIYNGKLAPKGSSIAKSTLSILWKDSKNNQYLCTGTVLSRDIILTAAHCVVEEAPSATGTWEISPEQAEILDVQAGNIPVKKIIAHPFYSRALDYMLKNKQGNSHFQGYDIALLKLQKPLSDFYQPVKIATNLETIYSEKAMLAGFGNFSLDKKVPEDGRLRFGPATLNAKDYYLQEFTRVTGDDFFNRISNSAYARVIQFTKQTNDASICHGDSGGPLYYESKGVIHQIGINVDMDFRGTDKPCVSKKTENQMATFLAGPLLLFLEESFKKLSGENLFAQPPQPAHKDPKQFEYYIKNKIEKPANTYLNFKNGVVLRTKFIDNSEQVLIVNAKNANPQNPCIGSTEWVTVETALKTPFDGVEPVAFAKTKHMEALSAFEGRVLDEKTHFMVAAVTPIGYVSARLPVIECKL